MPKFEPKPDLRTPECKHDQLHGCYHCCKACDYDEHRCGGCGEPMKHYACRGSRLGTCDNCREEFFTDD